MLYIWEGVTLELAHLHLKTTVQFDSKPFKKLLFGMGFYASYKIFTAKYRLLHLPL